MTRWFDRSFSFAFDASAHPYIRARLRGTPARLDELTQHLPKDVLTAHWLSAWSIQENVGHLLDVEPLWAARLDNFLDGSRTLEPADLTNRQTHEARHDDESINVLLGRFRETRLALMARLDVLRDDVYARTAYHARLQRPIRLVDHLFFVAEHDDHHLARIWELANAPRCPAAERGDPPPA